MDPSYVNGLFGGVLIGAGTLLTMVANGKVPGISGVFGRLLRPSSNETGWRFVFLAGLIAGAAVLFRVYEPASVFRVPDGRNLAVYAIAGLIVGFGTRLGGGCTSGHGICGISMGARDSMIATAVFMVAGMATVYVFRTLITG
ncbi:MAG: YeeE/YedE family protein [Verrucomicrobiales bacterium]|nr:YeeE/YedE family protein [Verrucomicrobiales bacterium]